MYSRSHPSPRYRQLLNYYQLLHKNGAYRRSQGEIVEVSAHDTFSGRGIIRHISPIQKLIATTSSRSVLDYGSGKGRQYSEDIRQKNGNVIAASLHEYWNVQQIACYDPGYLDSDAALHHQYDGVIATNVLDHIPEEDLPWVIELLFETATKFIYCNMSDTDANAWLPNGENARVTRKPASWWLNLFEKHSKKYPEIKYCLAFGRRRSNNEGDKSLAITHFHNSPDLKLPRGHFLGDKTGIQQSQEA